MIENVLSLDISTKTGWALIESGPVDTTLMAAGQIRKMAEPEGQYPANYIEWAYAVFGEILALIETLTPDILVIEETAAGSKNAMSQKILEYIHFLVARYIRDTGIRCMYILTESWRRETGCQLSTTEKKRNKDVKKYKEKHNTKLAKDANGKVMGKVGRKHVNIRRANEIFGAFLPAPLVKKDEDKADALMLAYCYHVRKLKRSA